ncbi:MAG: toprim domain-containing protein [Microthrixaceae bacterium]
MAGPQTSAVQDLIDALGRLPGIGPKSAQRIAYHLLKSGAEESRRLAEAVVAAKERVGFCARCFNLSEGELCPICADDRRDSHSICVVEEPRDVIAIERTREYRGRYHVLGGAIDHLQGSDPSSCGCRAARARRRRGGHRGDHLHQPQPRGRGDGALPEPGARHARAHRQPHSERPAGRR